MHLDFPCKKVNELFFPIKYLQVTVIGESLQTRTENLNRPSLNKRSFVLAGHFSLVTRVIIEYK
jgi:hypothetical protein